jgi:hypothetical protein
MIKFTTARKLSLILAMGLVGGCGSRSVDRRDGNALKIEVKSLTDDVSNLTSKLDEMIKNYDDVAKQFNKLEGDYNNLKHDVFLCTNVVLGSTGKNASTVEAVLDCLSTAAG